MSILNKILFRFYYKSNSDRYIEYLRKSGVKIGGNCIFREASSTAIYTTRPSLVEIGNYVDMNANFTILTHDYGTSVFLRKYKDFVNASGKVKIGDNIYFGKNCTLLKGITIGNNCIVRVNSLVIHDIPENSVAAGTPDRIICSLDDYFIKRGKNCLGEAFAYARSIEERYSRRPMASGFWEEFPLFVDGNEINNHPIIPIKKQLNIAFPYWIKNHKSKFKNFSDFLIAAGVKDETDL
jgi:acetyltransferase-like isoleucine patch superfamily enzyme